MYKEEAYEEVMLQEIEFELMNGETYTERVFLTGADPLSVGYEKMMRILKLIQKYYPYCGCEMCIRDSFRDQPDSLFDPRSVD